MIKVTFIEQDGTQHLCEGEEGMTLMELAVRHDVPAIEAECGGACACATCHVYIDPEWQNKTGRPEPMEEDMLDFAYDIRDTSRLSCQIRLTPQLNGLMVHLPERQA
jgi:2Fe-2S ferredoxin